MRPFAVRRAVRPLQRCVSPLLALACLAGGASHAAAQQLRWDGDFELREHAEAAVPRPACAAGARQRDQPHLATCRQPRRTLRRVRLRRHESWWRVDPESLPAGSAPGLGDAAGRVGPERRDRRQREPRRLRGLPFHLPGLGARPPDAGSSDDAEHCGERRVGSQPREHRTGAEQRADGFSSSCRNRHSSPATGAGAGMWSFAIATPTPTEGSTSPAACPCRPSPWSAGSWPTRTARRRRSAAEETTAG